MALTFLNTLTSINDEALTKECKNIAAGRNVMDPKYDKSNTIFLFSIHRCPKGSVEIICPG